MRSGAGSRKTVWLLTAAVLLTVWSLWWLYSLRQEELLGAEHMWLGVPAFGVDFWTQTEWAARRWDMGIDPYAERDEHLFHYPPIVIRLFLWSAYLPKGVALNTWICMLAAGFGVGTWYALRIRSRLGLTPRLSLPVALVAVLYSFPAIFTMERSNFDMVSLLAVLAAFAVYDPKRWYLQVLAGAFLAIAPWVKLYPGVIGLSLIALRWWRVLGGFVVGGILIGASMPEETLSAAENVRILIDGTKHDTTSKWNSYYPWSHSLSAAWTKLLIYVSIVTGGPTASPIPGALPAALTLAPLLGWVHWRIYRCRNPDAVAYPLLLWTIGLGSYLPQMANDYSLCFFPMLLVAVWSWRDPKWIQLALASTLVWFQPFALPIPAYALLFLKVLLLVVLGVLVVRRATEHEGAEEHSAETAPQPA